jgi:SEC-C motif
MAKSIKVNRNHPCPCGRIRKFKHCCYGKVDWERIFRANENPIPHLSTRGRNIHFINAIFDALQLNNEQLPSLRKYKAAFTASAVRRIHEAIEVLWPPRMDIAAALAREADDVSALYIGDYGLDYIARGIVRHSIYANKILVVDPFIYPRSVRDEFNPILNPGQYRSQALKNVNFWVSLMPWIQRGLVEVIRTPGDFDHKLNWDSMNRQQRKFEDSAELKQSIEATRDLMFKRHKDKTTLQQLILGAPDFYLENLVKELKLEKDGFTAKDYLRYVQEQRDRDPNFLEPLDPDSESGQLYVMTSGASYDMARITAAITKSYLVTDLPSKWLEIKFDRKSNNAESEVWSPFAKALQDSTLKYLNSLRLDHALRLRQEGRLEKLRNFFLSVWKHARTEEPFDEANSRLLTEELRQEIARAEVEWDQIDRDLIKIVGKELFAGLLAAGPLIASGHGLFVGAAAAAIGSATLAYSIGKRRSFEDRFPAAFFMKIDEEK